MRYQKHPDVALTSDIYQNIAVGDWLFVVCQNYRAMLRIVWVCPSGKFIDHAEFKRFAERTRSNPSPLKSTHVKARYLPGPNDAAKEAPPMIKSSEAQTSAT